MAEAQGEGGGLAALQGRERALPTISSSDVGEKGRCRAPSGVFAWYVWEGAWQEERARVAMWCSVMDTYERVSRGIWQGSGAP